MRQVAGLLERENDRLHAKLTALTRELSQLRGDGASAAQRQLEALQEILAHREHALFGASSEKRPPPTPAGPAAAVAPRRGHGPTPQPTLPIIDVVHELAETDRTCPACGGTLREMAGQTEDAEARRVRLTMSELQLFLEGSPLVGRIALSPAPFFVGETRKDLAARATR